MLLDNPKRWQPVLSPDGSRIAYLAPNEHDTLQIWVRTLGKNDNRCERGPIQVYRLGLDLENCEWGCDSKTILYGQDKEGDENYHYYAIDLDSGNVRDLTPWQGVRCDYTMARMKRPGEILAVLNFRDRKLMEVWRIDLRTGAAVLEVENPGDVSWWVADDDLVVRGARARTPDGGFEVRVRTGDNAPWRTLLRKRLKNGSSRWISARTAVTSFSYTQLEATLSAR